MYATQQQVFQLQVNRHQTATENLINATYAHFQRNHTRYADALQSALEVAGILGQLAVEGIRDVCKGIVAIAVFLIAAVTLTVVAVRRLNQWCDAQIDESIPTEPATWWEALETLTWQDFTVPLLYAWAIDAATPILAFLY